MQFKSLFNHGKYGDAINYNVLLCKQQYSEKNIAIIGAMIIAANKVATVEELFQL